MPYNEYFNLTLDTQAPTLTSVDFVDSVLTDATDYDAVPITLTTSASDVAQMYIYGCKGMAHKEFTADGTTTSWTYEADSSVITSALTSVEVYIDGETPSASYTIDTETTAGVVSITPAPDDDSVIKVRYEKKVLGQNEAEWQNYSASTTIKLDKTTVNTAGTVTISAKIRDDVWNVSSVETATVSVDADAPVVTVTGITCPVTTSGGYKISTVSGRDTITVTFTVSEDIQAWKVVKVASQSAGASDVSNVAIPSTAGSTTSATDVDISSGTPVTATIKGTDFQTAVTTDNEYVVKVFAQDKSGNWSA